MDASFRAVAAAARNQTGPLSHQQQVTRLYRHSLRLLFSWVVDRDLVNERGLELRARFDAVKSPTAGEGALLAGQQELADFAHPDPYVIPYMPGGTKFMRNPPLPPEIVYAAGPGGDDEQPHKIPESAYTGTNTPVWPDMVPITWRPHMTGALIDFGKKNME